MQNALNSGLDSLKGTLQSEQFKKILPYLLIGGGGAAAGAYMTGGRRKNKRKQESRMGYLSRVLGNALAVGGLSAGAAGLASYGAGKLGGKTEENGKQLAGLDNPTDQALRSSLFSPVTALGAGTAGLLATHKIPGIGANTAPRDQMREAVAEALGYGKKGAKGKFTPNVAALMGASPAELAAKATGKPIDGLPFEKAIRQAGITIGNPHPKASMTGLNPLTTLKNMITSPSSARSELGAAAKSFKGSEVGNMMSQLKKHPGDLLHELKNLSGQKGFKYNAGRLREAGSMITRRGMSTLGQTTGRRGLRTGVGLAAAAIPALIGAFATPEKEN